MRSRAGEAVLVVAAAFLITAVMTWPLVVRGASAGRIDPVTASSASGTWHGWRARWWSIRAASTTPTSSTRTAAPWPTRRPISAPARWLNDLITRGFVSCAYLGVRMLSATPAVKEEYALSVDSGALVVEVVSGSPADDAGLRADDVIIKFAGTDVADADQLRALIRSRNVGDRVAITYVRGEDTFTTEATLVLRPST